LAKVGVGTGTTQTEPAYITAVEGQGSTIDVGGTQKLTVEVRDDYNKPLRGATVRANVSEGSIGNSSETGSEGQATFEYNTSGLSLSPGEDRTEKINFTIEEGYEPDLTHEDQSPENLTMEVTVQREDTSSSSGGGDLLPGPRPTNLTLDSKTVVQGETLDIINATFDNQGNTSFNRGGTDVVGGEYYIVEGNVTNPNDGGAVVRGSLNKNEALPLTPLEPRNLTLNTNGTIDTANPDSLDLGNYTVFIRGQDTRGVWTNESFDGYTGKTFEVVQEPSVKTNAATDVGETTVTLNGELTDLGSANSVDVYFEYRESGGTWIETAKQPLSAAGTYSEEVTGLDSGTEYEFRAVADGDRISRAGTRTFMTNAGATMADRTDITSAEATNGDGSIVDFTVEKTGADNVIITGFGIDYANGGGDADNINNGGNNEIEFTNGGFFDAGGGNSKIQLGDPAIDFEVDGAGGAYETISGGDPTTGTLTEFQAAGSGKSGGPVDVEGDIFEITLEFQDGSSDTYVITVG
jgi:hypothetical protein